MEEKNIESFYDESEKSFDYIGTDSDSAIIFLSNEAVREKIAEELKKNEWFVVEARSAQETLKRMRFHTYTLLVVDDFSNDDESGKHDLIDLYLTNTPMSVRRKTFVTLVSKRLRTMDRLAACNQGVNLIISAADIKDFSLMISNNLAENDWFYSIFMDVLKAYGK